MKILNKVLSVDSKINNKTKQMEADLYIYGDISMYDFWGDEVTPNAVLEELAKIKNVSILNLHINSHGGSIDAGNSMIVLLNNYRKKNNVQIHGYVEGIAASMGSALIMVCNKIFMYDNSMMMLHKPLTRVEGNEDILQSAIDQLKKYKDICVANYMARFNGTEEELEQLLSEETFLTAQEAKDYNLCDEILKGIEVVSSAKGITVNNCLFEKKDIVDIFKSKIQNIREEKIKDMKYDIALNDIGISEEQFNLFESSIAFAQHIQAKCAEQEKPVVEFISMALAKEKLDFEQEFTADDVISLALKGKNYKEPDLIVEDKAKEYDKLFKNLVKNTISKGITAMGIDNFNEESWNKMLSQMNYSDVENISETWEKQGKLVNNAGKQISTSKTTSFSDAAKAINENYNL